MVQGLALGGGFQRAGRWLLGIEKCRCERWELNLDLLQGAYDGHWGVFALNKLNDSLQKAPCDENHRRYPITALHSLRSRDLYDKLGAAVLNVHAAQKSCGVARDEYFSESVYQQLRSTQRPECRLHNAHQRPHPTGAAREGDQPAGGFHVRPAHALTR